MVSDDDCVRWADGVNVTTEFCAVGKFYSPSMRTYR